ncbi:MAG: hypothetical protein DGJ47_000967 [Rickettsiaceae bacterium]
MKNLLIQEIIRQNKLHHLVKHFFLFILFALTSTVITHSPDHLQKFGLTLSIIYIPLFLLSISYSLIKSEINDGSLELLLTIKSSFEIVIAKFLALVCNGFFSFALLSPAIFLFFSPEANLFVIFALCALLTIMLSATLIILIACIQGYFRNNTNFLTVVILPLLFPNMIFTGMVIEDPSQLSFIFIMSGINLMMVPPILYLSQYLMDNIYNI